MQLILNIFYLPVAGKHMKHTTTTSTSGRAIRAKFAKPILLSTLNS